MKIDGHCHCGRITFEAEVDPNTITICHCTDCQMLTGSAFRANVLAAPRISCSAAARRELCEDREGHSAATPSRRLRHAHLRLRGG
jgi:hypothetical protein